MSGLPPQPSAPILPASAAAWQGGDTRRSCLCPNSGSPHPAWSTKPGQRPPHHRPQCSERVTRVVRPLSCASVSPEVVHPADRVATGRERTGTQTPGARPARSSTGPHVLPPPGWSNARLPATCCHRSIAPEPPQGPAAFLRSIKWTLPLPSLVINTGLIAAAAGAGQTFHCPVGYRLCRCE